ncbi:MAG: response regulator, partial [Bdellovibrionales bacterium]|nr:response regulator [Bdellovibrionales bacterium]
MSTRVLEILLVDDEPDLLDIVKVFISTLYQAQFTFAHSGKEAITHLKKGHQYDVVVCDYEMNDGNGGEVYSFMKSEGIKIPFILLSAYDPSRYSEFSDGGVAGYVNKPHIFEPLTEILEQLLGSPESFSPGNKEEKFVEVGLTLLKNIEVAPTNFYVRLGEGHAVKVIYKGSLISQKDLLRYSDKGVTSLLFDVLDAEVFLKSYSETVFSLLEDYHNVAGEGEQEHYYKQT